MKLIFKIVVLLSCLNSFGQDTICDLPVEQQKKYSEPKYFKEIRDFRKTNFTIEDTINKINCLCSKFLSSEDKSKLYARLEVNKKGKVDSVIFIKINSSNSKLFDCISNYSKKMFLFKKAICDDNKKIKTGHATIIFDLKC